MSVPAVAFRRSLQIWWWGWMITISIWVRDLKVPMHLGLINGPFVPHNLIPAQWSPVPLPKFQMAPRLHFQYPLGPRKMNPDMNFLFLSKVPVKEPPPGSLTGPLWTELPVYKAFFTCLSNSHKNFPKQKKIFLFFKGLRKGASFHVPQKRGPYGNRRPFPEP